MLKLKRNTWPTSHTPDNFQCFGPVAIKDGEFSGTQMADLGCFKQGEVDSNKFLHCAVVKSKLTNTFFFYTEFGRTGVKPGFQFYQCDSQSEAQLEYEKYLHKKNDKRGEWVKHPKLGKILQPRKNKDCYLVRPQTVRSVGLPDAHTIVRASPDVGGKTHSGGFKKKFDNKTVSLLRDLNFGTVSYTRQAISGNVIPTMEAISEARIICDEATKIVNRENNNLSILEHDQELVQLSNLLYSRIPKPKIRGGNIESWLLTASNIHQWTSDLDAFESASQNLHTKKGENPLEQLDITLEWIDPASQLGEFLYEWIPTASRNVHSYIPGKIKIKNLWFIKIPKQWYIIKDYQNKIIKEIGDYKSDRPQFQPNRKNYLEEKHLERFKKSRTFLLFHGTKSTNVAGILNQGLRLPKTLSNVSITGGLFGSSSLYAASDFRKSVGYCSIQSGYWSRGQGKIKNRGAFMFLTDFTLGKSHIPRYGQTKIPQGYHSFWAKQGKSGVMNDEFIINTAKAHYLRYLIEFDI